MGADWGGDSTAAADDSTGVRLAGCVGVGVGVGVGASSTGAAAASRAGNRGLGSLASFTGCGSASGAGTGRSGGGALTGIAAGAAGIGSKRASITCTFDCEATGGRGHAAYSSAACKATDPSTAADRDRRGAGTKLNAPARAS
jgi:hypothetical protein